MSFRDKYWLQCPSCKHQIRRLEPLIEAVADVLDYKHNYLSFQEGIPNHIEALRHRMKALEEALAAAQMEEK